MPGLYLMSKEKESKPEADSNLDITSPIGNAYSSPTVYTRYQITQTYNHYY